MFIIRLIHDRYMYMYKPLINQQTNVYIYGIDVTVYSVVCIYKLYNACKFRSKSQLL